jgi:hypothetical protein
LARDKDQRRAVVITAHNFGSTKCEKFVERQSDSAHAGSSLTDFSTLKMEAIRSSETSVHTRSTRRHIPEDGIAHSHRRENLRSYKIGRGQYQK